jgi:hypothetical protein
MFKNLEAILVEAGSGLDRVLNANIFLVSEEEYGEFNEVYIRVCYSFWCSVADLFFFPFFFWEDGDFGREPGDEGVI